MYLSIYEVQQLNYVRMAHYVAEWKRRRQLSSIEAATTTTTAGIAINKMYWTTAKNEKMKKNALANNAVCLSLTSFSRQIFWPSWNRLITNPS